MPRYAQLVMGPAGSGKSTYCSNLVKHCEVLRRTVHVVNLDPAAEHFDYPVLADIRELISVDDVMEDQELRLGPNGGLVFCMEYLAKNLDWLQEELDEIEDDYILFDCPGQIELYTHLPVMRQLVEHLHSRNFLVCGVFLIDARFMIEAARFVSGVMSTLSAMVTLEIPHVNIMSKMDLLDHQGKKDAEKFFDPDMQNILHEELDKEFVGKKFAKLNSAICNMIDDYSLVKFLPLDITEEDSINDVLMQIDIAIQYGEDFEPKEPKDEDFYLPEHDEPEHSFFDD